MGYGRGERAKTVPRIYTDERGWLYKVMRGPSSYKVGFQREQRDWHKTQRRCFPWCETFEECQRGLDAYAKRYGWKEVV